MNGIEIGYEGLPLNFNKKKLFFKPSFDSLIEVKFKLLDDAIFGGII